MAFEMAILEEAPSITGEKQLTEIILRKPERHKRVTEIVREILEIAQVEPAAGSTYDKQTWKFVWNFVNSRLRPEHKNKTVTAQDSLATRIARMVAYNLDLGFADEVSRYENYTAKKSGKDVDTLHIYYGCGETEEGLEFLKSVCDDPEKIQLQHEIPRKGRVLLHLRHPKDVPLNSKVINLLKEYPNIEFDHQPIPLTAEQIRVIDMEVDKGKYMERVGRLESQARLEIRQPTVDKTISEIVSQLPEDSKLRKIISDHQKDISVQVYENVKLYSGGNLEDAVGYLFEACVVYELEEDGLDEVIASLFKSENVSVKMGGEPYQTYRSYCSSRFQSHTDGLIMEGSTQIVGIVECKTSPNPAIFGDTSDQISRQVQNLPTSIAASMKDSSNAVSVAEPRDMTVIVIKPNCKEEVEGGKKRPQYKTISDIAVVGQSKTYIIRSSIDYADLQTAKSIFNRSKDEGK